MRILLWLTALTGCVIIAGGPNANAVGLIDEEFPPIPGWSAVLPDPFRITFDEFGRGSYVQNGLPTVHPVTGTLLPDPTVGIGARPSQC